jgi:hypothetical protein
VLDRCAFDELCAIGRGLGIIAACSYATSTILFGIIYPGMDDTEAWKQKVVMELKAAKLKFDANHLWQ